MTKDTDRLKTRHHGCVFPNVEGYVLAGGRSSRMGRDKFQLSLEGESFLERAVRQFTILKIPCSVVASPSQSFPGCSAPVIHDLRPGTGPLGGVYTALRHCRGQKALILPCDVPLVSADLLQLLLREAEGVDIVLPVDRTGRRHSLCALYSAACLPSIEAQLDRGDLKVRSLLDQSGLRVKTIRIEDEGIPESALLNINTPEELKSLEKLCGPSSRSR